MASDTKKASLVIGANTESAVASINNLSVAMTKMASDAKKAGSDANTAFSSGGNSLKVWENRLDNVKVSLLSGENAAQRLANVLARATVKGIDLSPLQQEITLTQEAINLQNQMVARRKEESAAIKQAAADYAALEKQIESATARALSGMPSQSADYFRNQASVSGIVLTQDTTDSLTRLQAIQQANSQTNATIRQTAQETRRIETEARSIESAIRNATTSYATAGMTASQSLEYRIQQSGLDASRFQPALTALKQAEQQYALVNTRAKEGDRYMQQYGLTAKQYAASLRGVPAQITDIVVSLQGGQRPLTVLLQQGGQLKDMFGGVLPAVRALSSTLLSLVSPATVIGTVVGTLGVALYQGADESQRLNKALISTGNAAGMTATELSQLAEQAGEASGNYSEAREAVEALASSGKLSGDEITAAMQGIQATATVTGKSVSDVAQQFVQLAEKPSEAVLKLNEGTNFLTASVYRQIVSLEKQGKTTEAAQLAMETLADTMSTRAEQMEENLGYIEYGWLKVKDAILGAWEALKALGRENTRQNLEYAQQHYDNSLLGGDEAQISHFKAELDRLKAQEAEEKRIANERAARIKAENAEIKKIAEQNKTTGTGRTASSSSSGSSYYQETSQSIARQIEQLKQEAQQEGALTTAQKLRIQVEAQATDGKKKLTKAQKESLLAQISELETLEKAKLQKEFVTKYEEDYQKALKKTTQSYEDQIATVGMGTKEAEQYRKELQIMREAYEKIDEASKKGILPEDYDTTILENAREQIRLLREETERYKTAWNDAGDAMQSVLTTYKEQAEDAGTQVRDLTKDAFQGMEDAFVKFATTGKVSFSDLVDSIIEDIARIYAKKATASLFEWLFSFAGDSISSGLNSMTGSLSSSSYSLTSAGSSVSGLSLNRSYSGLSVSSKGYASGGRVNGKTAYLVGEEGPELFVPDSSGSIVPNHQLGTSLGTGGISIQINQQNEGTAKQVSDTSTDFDGENLIIRIVTKDIQNDGMISRSMSKAFGVRRAAGTTS